MAVWYVDIGIRIHHSTKKQDADQMIDNICRDMGKAFIGMDAPLSLPGIYKGLPDCRDYFFRQCDIQLSAMSPMFMGGLSARAIQLTDRLREQGHRVLEVYPSALKRLFPELADCRTNPSARHLAFFESYFQTEVFFENGAKITSHALDSLCALMTMCRYTNGESQCAGNEEEGIIYY
jgi:predicted nuclease with RNAse H fold